MDLSSGHPGVIIYGQEDVDHAPNLYVICRTTGGENNGRHKGPDESRLNQLRRMLDELSIESLPSHDIQVRMVMKGRKRSGA
jgi:hypothetical protein